MISNLDDLEYKRIVDYAISHPSLTVLEIAAMLDIRPDLVLSAKNRYDRENKKLLDAIEKKDQASEEKDWGQFRRESAKDIFCAMMMSGIQDTWRIMAENAITATDELIKQLREEKK